MRELFLFYSKVLKNPVKNIPSLLFLTVAIFGIVTLISSFVTDILIFPFTTIATISSFIAMWYIKVLGTLSENLEKMEGSIDELNRSNSRLHSELKAMESLRKSLEEYADESNSNLREVVDSINSSFQKLERITEDNERVLLYKIAQDLEFMDNSFRHE